MRRRLIVLLTSTVLVGVCAAQQVRFGLRCGVSTAATPTTVESFNFGAGRYELNVNDIPLGVHVGVVLQARAQHWVFQPELIFHATRTDYQLREIFNGTVFTSIREEKFSHAEIPLLVAYRWGPLRLQAGPTGRILLASSSELQGVADYVMDADSYSIGYQAGIGLDIRRVILDVKFDGSFSGLGSNILVGGESLAFNNSAGRTYASLGILLF